MIECVMDSSACCDLFCLIIMILGAEKFALQTGSPRLDQRFLNSFLKNVASAGKTRQKWWKKRSVHGVHEHFSASFNAALFIKAWTSAVVFQQAVNEYYWVILCGSHHSFLGLESYIIEPHK